MPLNFERNPDQPAHSFIDSMHDWSVAPGHGKKIHGEVAYLYCFDLSSSFNWMGCMSFNSFLHLAQEINDAPDLWGHAAGALDECFDSTLVHARRQLEQPANESHAQTGSDPNIALLNSLATFCITNQIVASHLNIEPGCHCIAVRYQPTHQTSIMRSFVISASLAKAEGRLNLEDFHDWVRLLVTRDKKENPDWFS